MAKCFDQRGGIFRPWNFIAARDLAQAARSPRCAASPAIPVPATVPPAAEPEATAAAAAATSAAEPDTTATSETTAPAATSAAAAPATSAATTASSGFLHAAANVFLIEDIERGETDVDHFLFAKNEALIG